MGELTGPDAVARLIGDPWNPEGLLTSRVRAQPFCVVLLDEIEKAHPRALHLLLQLFDEGRLTDAAGEVASFASAVVIMTSNLGSKNAQPIGFGETRDRVLADVARAVREFFPVELFNRIDQVVPFEPLTPEVAAHVVDKELAKLLARRGLREHDTFVYAGSAVRRRAVADAFDPRYGARTVKRWLEDARRRRAGRSARVGAAGRGCASSGSPRSAVRSRRRSSRCSNARPCRDRTCSKARSISRPPGSSPPSWKPPQRSRGFARRTSSPAPRAKRPTSCATTSTSSTSASSRSISCSA